MNTAKYLAQKTLLEYEIKSFPIETEKIVEILKKEGYKILRTEQNIEILKPLLGDKLIEFSQKPAFTICSDDIKAVFYSSRLTAEERTETLTHELGHIRCGHISDGIVLGYCDDCKTANRQEQEAQSFMREFLAPLCLMRKMNVATSEDTERLFLLSKTNAAKQYAELNRPGLRETQTEKAVLKPYNKNPLLFYKIAFLFTFVLLTFSVSSQLFNYKEKHSDNIKTAPVQQAPQNSVVPISTPTISPVQCSSTYMITSSGRKYHLSTCRYVKNKTNTIEITLEEALQLNKEPCSECIK